MKSLQLSKLIQRVGDYYKDKSTESHRKFAYWKASKAILDVLGPDHEVDENYDFTVISGVGKVIQSTITKILTGGRVFELHEETLDEYFKSLDPKLVNLFVLNGLNNSADLMTAILDRKKCHIIPDHVIEHFGRMRIDYSILEMMNHLPGILVGSARRDLPTIHDLDFLVVQEDLGLFDVQEYVRLASQDTGFNLTPINDGKKMGRFFVSYRGRTVSCDFKVVPRESIGTAMLHFTGPVRSNIVTRAKAKSIGYTLNEYGLWRGNENLTLNLGESEVIYILNGIGVKVNLDPTLR